MHIIKSSPCFIDTEISLQAEFACDRSNNVILLGAHDLSKTHTIADYKKTYDKVIIFNQEQIGTRYRNFMTFEYYRMLRDADEVWDYDEYNLAGLRLMRSDVKLHILQPCKELNAGNMAKTTDVLFYGWINDRRQVIINKLKADGISVAIPHHIYGNDLNPYIASSKVCLNIHYYPDTALQEQARMIRWISSNATIVSEKSRHNYFNVNEVSYDHLVETIKDML